MATFTDESRKHWGTRADKATEEEIRTGCFQRMAAALETMASNWTSLERERDMYKRWHEEQRVATQRLQYQVRGLRGALTRIKNNVSKGQARGIVGAIELRKEQEP